MKRLLLAEDEPRIAEFLVRGLSRRGIEVTVAGDGEVARFLGATEMFDGVVLTSRFHSSRATTSSAT